MQAPRPHSEPTQAGALCRSCLSGLCACAELQAVELLSLLLKDWWGGWTRLRHPGTCLKAVGVSGVSQGCAHARAAHVCVLVIIL